MRISQIYRPHALTCRPEDSLLDAARAMLAEQVGALAVLHADQVVGILSERDVLRAVAQGADVATATVADFASHPVQTALPEEDATQVARRMLDAGVRHLPVQRDDTLLGVISMRDLLAVESWM